MMDYLDFDYKPFNFVAIERNGDKKDSSRICFRTYLGIVDLLNDEVIDDFYIGVDIFNEFVNRNLTYKNIIRMRKSVQPFFEERNLI